MLRRGFARFRNAVCVRSYLTRTRKPYSTQHYIDSRLIPEHDFSSFDVANATPTVASLSKEFLGATLQPQDFGAMFQECAPYIDVHREKIIVSGHNCTCIRPRLMYSSAQTVLDKNAHRVKKRTCASLNTCSVCQKLPVGFFF